MHQPGAARRPLLIALVAAAVVFAGCGGGGKKNVDTKSSSNSSTSTTTADDMTTTTSAAGGAVTTGSKPTGTTVKAGTSATTAAGGPATTAASSAGSTSTVGAKPGTYTYKTTGTASSGTPPTTAPVDSTSTLKVDAATGTDQHTVQSSQQGGDTETTYRYLSNGIFITYLKASQVNAEFKPNPPVVALPHPWTVGQAWSWDMTSTDGKTTIHGDFKVTGTESVTVGGQAVDCVKLDYTLTIKASFNGAPITVTISGTRWQSEKYSLLVKDHSVADAGAFGKTDTTSVLQSLTPA